MACLAVDSDRTEKIFIDKPVRGDGIWEPANGNARDFTTMDNGMIEFILGRNLFWEDKPVEWGE